MLAMQQRCSQQHRGKSKMQNKHCSFFPKLQGNKILHFKQQIFDKKLFFSVIFLFFLEHPCLLEIYSIYTRNVMCSNCLKIISMGVWMGV